MVVLGEIEETGTRVWNYDRTVVKSTNITRTERRVTLIERCRAAALFAQAGFLVVTAFISPYRADRNRIREAHTDLFHEVYLSASVEECARRDPKGRYAKARAGFIFDFTGVSAPYEPPPSPELRLETEHEPLEQSLAALTHLSALPTELQKRLPRNGPICSRG
jgi:adenylylsulfate kinase-like enzyme